MKNRPVRRKGLGPWQGRIFLSVGRALYLGPAGDTTQHAHHAAQVCVALDASLRLRHENGPWREYDGVVISPDVPHQLDGGRGDLALFYVEPEGRHGRRRSRTEGEGVRPLQEATIMNVRAATARIAMHPPAPARLVEVFEVLMASAGLARDPSERPDNRIERALEQLRESPRRRETMPEVARRVGLSPSRFRHLFRRDVGMSAQSYVVWLRIYEACASLAQGSSLSEAAHDAGFSDAAHFTRTFRRTFGLAPSQVAGLLSLM